MRPLDVGQTLDMSFKLLTARFKELALVTAVVLLPINVLSIFVTKALLDEVQNGVSYGRFNTHILFYQGGTSFLNMLATYLAQAACLYVLAAWYLRREELSGAGALREALSRMPSILWVVFLVALAVTIGMVACILPGIWLLVAFSVAIPALVVEGVRGTAALGRSYDLVKGRWWATLGRFIVAALLTFAAAFVVGAIVGIGGGAFSTGTSITTADSSLGSIAIQVILQWAANIVVLPFWAAVATVVYFDLRVRKEGFDVSQMASGTATATGVPQAPQAPPAAPTPTGPQVWGQAPGAAPSAWGQAPAPPPQPDAPAAPPAATPRPGGSVAPPGAGWSAPAAPAPPAPPPPADTPSSALESSLGGVMPEPPSPPGGHDPLTPRPPEDERGA